jgi:hypothetical protein
MKRAVVLSLCLLSVSLASVALATGPTQAAKARGGAKVLCWNKNFPPPTGSGGPGVKRKPNRCTFFKRGESTLSGAIQAFGLKWKKWGSKTARGTGKVTASMGNISRLRVKLRNPASGCRGRVYSKAKFRTIDFDTRTKMRLWTRCK